MIDALQLYFRFLAVSLRGQMQYRASFIMNVIGQFLITGIDFLAVWALFARFGTLKGWTLPEVALFYGLINVAFALADATSRGFDQFHQLVKRGDFDRLLLRPRSTALQLAGQELVLRRIGRLSQGLIVLGWAVHALPLALTPAHLALMLWTVLGGACLFYGLIVLQATSAFWTAESIEMFNVLSYGGVMTGQYPLTIYRGWFRRFFTVVFPLGAVSYFPVLALLGRPDPLGTTVTIQCLAPLAGILFLLVALQVWKIGVRHYCSTGS